ncbi:alpha/beta hydrolase [Thalassobaculum sp.]|uniref:alpha/beta fold hydrolase n=1 Tax=Thalassobaculum sp. TaxID=2022740 RepID=UPI0032EBA132
MSETASDDGIDFVEQGDGPAVLFVSGSFGTPAAWRGMWKRLPAGYRLVATSILGYGATRETRTPADLDMAHEVRVIGKAAARIGAPVHLVGHSFGGTVALVAALAGVAEIRSIATFEANPLALIREHGSEELYERTRMMSLAFEAAHAGGERDAAGRIIDFWGGAGSFAAMPEVVQDYCRTTAGANVLDWRTAFAFAASKADYARLDIPVLLVRGSAACQEMATITDGLAACLPNVRPAVVEGASHFLITSHPDACAGLLADFLGDLEG